MIKTIKNSGTMIGCTLLSLILAMSLVSAVAVSSPYWTENPLKMYPGETKDISLNIQNMVGSEDLILKGSLTSGSEIARITDSNTEYDLPAQSSDRRVNIRIFIPKEIPLGTEYSVGLSFTTAPKNNPGQFTLGTAIDTSFPVIIGEKPAAQPSPPEGKIPLWAYIAIAIIIIIIIIIILKKRANRKPAKI